MSGTTVPTFPTTLPSGLQTSGSVIRTPFTTLRVIEHAFRRAGRVPERASPEDLSVAQDLLFTQLSAMMNAGFPLWTREFRLLSCAIGRADVACVEGTNDVLHAYWRILNPYRGSATMAAIGGTGAAPGPQQITIYLRDGYGHLILDGYGNPIVQSVETVPVPPTLPVSFDASVLFGGQPNPDVTVPAPDPAVTVNFGTPTEVDTIGILPGLTSTPATMTIGIFISTDGLIWAPFSTLPATQYQPMVWSYYDLPQSVTTQYIRLQVIQPQGGFTIGVSGIGGPDGIGGTNVPWILNQLQLGLANGEDIEIGPLNIDDYYNLPNKQFQSDRAVSAYVDRKLVTPIVKIWPTLNQGGFYNGTVSALTRRYLQDVGQLTGSIEVPPRWFEATIWRLAYGLIFELPDPDKDSAAQGNYFTAMIKQQRITTIKQELQQAVALAWSEERTKAPLRLAPDISCYTT